MKTVRIYGIKGDHGSYGKVTAGFEEGLRILGMHSGDVDVVGLDEDQTFEEEPSGLPEADVAILTGPPMLAARMTQGSRHAVRAVMIAPNSSRLPERTMHTVNGHATLILVPSRWAAGVVRGYTEHPVLVVPHGVSAAFWNVPHLPVSVSLAAHAEAAANFRVLHLSSTDGERKGTLELCKAFTECVRVGALPKDAELRLLVTPKGRGRLLDELEFTRGITLVTRAAYGFDAASMAFEYGRAHLVCQPSRGEGFGMVPLEALVCGTPVAATACTGHSEWFHGLEGSAALIETGADAPIDDMPGAVAPSLSVEAVMDALVHAYTWWPSMKQAALDGAKALGRSRSWPAAIAPLVEHLQLLG